MGTTNTQTWEELKSILGLSDYSEGAGGLDVATAKDKASQAATAYDTKVNTGFVDTTKYNEWLAKKESRQPFSYDFNTDALYQQYKDKYIKQGKMAMADTIGQASAMTGGYGNSYAVTAGNQAYQASLENLNDVIPELYQLAYDKYTQEGQEINEMISIMGAERDYQRGLYNDEVAKLLEDRKYYQGIADSLADDDYNRWLDDVGNKYGAYRDGIADEQWQKDYDLDDRQVKIAEEQWDYEKKALNDALVDKGTTPTGANYDNGSLSKAQIETLQRFLGVEVDGYYGEKSKKAAGGLTAEEAYKKFVQDYSAPGYFDFNVDDYNKNSKENGGSSYSTVLKDLKEMKASGKSSKEAMAYLEELVSNSLITQSDYMSLYNKYRDGKL